MRKIEHISPSGLAKYRDDPEQYYLRYLATQKLPNEPQTQPMSIGSSFDAYAKSYLYGRLFGENHDPMYSFQALFEAQVEPHNRDWALVHGQYAFDLYKKTGCLADLMLELQHAINVPKFEIEVKGVVSGSREPATLTHGGVVLLGKPDVFYINAHAAHVIVDFKVNGWCSKQPISPKPGYVRLRNDPKKNGAHRDCALAMHHGMMINVATSLNKLEPTWAAQLAIYAWLCGCEIGEDFIAGIDQLACAPSKTRSEFPDVRIAEHRLRIDKDFQMQVFNQAQDLWTICHSDHFFRNMSREESLARCQILDKMVENQLAEQDPMFLAMTQSHMNPYRPQ